MNYFKSKLALILFLLLSMLSTANSAQPPDLSGAYRLAEGWFSGKDENRKYEYSMGKMVVEKISENKILILSAKTPKGKSTVGSVEVFEKLGKDLFRIDRLGIRKKEKFFRIDFKDFFVRVRFFINGRSLIAWRKVGKEEKLNKSLEKTLIKQREIYVEHWQKNIEI